ncbi:glucans biosynthesis glucosyltransferase MdoH [Jiella sonneratiae]|uniref:Glucans biosynthesis glucosyltransferase H n=1 Tax=Jiella sonneratiae TaxID=2816856 RepID=A0ABS3J1C6_9HYPH|nr:glucans biosynthesis glucosyltransferase MdoH [Jiella sonneratiae]MBO0903494.1 glucans biosynthesis glucosyltransferase MdoH [Jiella sonneratiae]
MFGPPTDAVAMDPTNARPLPADAPRNDVPTPGAPTAGVPAAGVAATNVPAPRPVVTAGLPVRLRRGIVLSLNLATIGGLAAAALAILSDDGLDALDAVVFAGFLLTTPFTVLGCWNAVIGLALIRFGRPERSVYPYFAETGGRAAPSPTSRTDLLVFLRNEAPEPIFARLEAMRRSLAATGKAERFRFAVLSDTSDPLVAAAERCAFDRFAHLFASLPEASRPLYRRRADNTGYKAGNLRDFLAGHAEESDFFLPLDSDSLMGAGTILRMVEAMEANPQIGILQSLVVGMPATSGFARLFQFGMRHGMRSFTMGSAWWNADCGPYWGHNALVRTRPFHAHCDLPVLSGKPPLGGPVLSHDQLEAVYMRRAGFEVRVVPVETRSFETNPPTLLEFKKRDLRWCQGNMQYFPFLFEKGLQPVSRFQILQAILMYVAPLAWLIMTLAAAAKALAGGYDPATVERGLALFATLFIMALAPKLAGVADVLTTRGAMRAYGGASRFLASVVLELAAAMLIAPIVAVYVSVFLVGLCFGRRVGWNGQNRDRLGVPLSAAARALAPQTALGLSLTGVLLLSGSGAAVLLGLPFLAGLLLAVPFTALTAAPAFGRLTTWLGLFAIPEETIMPPVLRSVVSPAARRWRRPARRPVAAAKELREADVSAGRP